MFFRIPRKISREIRKIINIETLLVQIEKMELQVLLDCKTGRNTLERMIKTFLKFLNPVFLRLEYLSRNKDQDYRMGQLMLCVF
jgi:hypothetical protein